MISHIHSKNTELKKKVDHNYPMKLLCVVGFLCHKLYMKTKIISNTKEFNIKKTKDI
jgi:hypothetical protein